MHLLTCVQTKSGYIDDVISFIEEITYPDFVYWNVVIARCVLHDHHD